MKNRIVLVGLVAVMLPLVYILPTYAVAIDASTTNADSLETRIEKRKARFTDVMSTVQEARIKSKCKSAQTILKNLQERNDTLKTKRTASHDKLTTNLASLMDKLKNNKVDISTLTTQIAELKTKITTFDTDLATYAQSVDDLVSVNCASDPSTFMLALSAAREERVTLAKDNLAIATYLKETIKPTIVTLRAEVTPVAQETE